LENTSVGPAVFSLMTLLGIAAFIYLAARRFRLQFSTTLVFVGLGLGELIRRVDFFESLGNLQLSPEIVTFVLLPVLMFEAALSLDSRLLFKHAMPILVLAVPSVLVSFVVIGLGVHWTIGIPLGAALLFGAMVSATDSTAAVAVFRELGAPTRLGILMDGENLFNDATSILVFRITAGMLALAGGAALVGSDGVVALAGSAFLTNFVGGLLLGGLFGLLFGQLIGEIQDEELIQILLTTTTAYLSFLFAELIQVSGVMAAVGAGLTLSGWGRTKFSPGAMQFLQKYWGFMSFVASSLAFLLVGITIDLSRLVTSPETGQGFLGPIGLAIVICIFARAVSVFGLFPIVNRLPGVEDTDLRYQAVMVWGGLRGAVPLVLAMTLPVGYEYRELFLNLAIGTVLFSLVVQATTLKALMRFLGLQEPTPSEAYIRDEGLLEAKHHARERIGELRRAGFFSDGVMADLDARYAADEAEIRAKIDDLRKRGLLGSREEVKLVKRQKLLLEKRVYADLFNRGQLSEKALKGLQHSIELQLDYLRAGHVLPGWTIHAPLRSQLEVLMFRAFDVMNIGTGFVQRLRLNHIANRYEEHWGRMLASEAVLKELEKLDGKTPHAELIPELMELYGRWNRNARQRLDAIMEQFPEYATKVQQLMATRLCLQAEEEIVNELEHLQILPDREARAMREELRAKLRRLRQKPIQELQPRPRELLAKVPLFQGLPEEEVEHVLERLEPRTFLADEMVVREGSPGDALFMIGRGVIRITRGGQGLPVTTVATLHAGDFFGEMAVLTGNVRNATATAVTHSTLYQLRRTDLHALAGICPVLQEVIESTYQERLSQLRAATQP
jgi:CPA1 family monovalent cation:H+ antiporter